MDKSGKYLQASAEVLERLIIEEQNRRGPLSHLKVFDLTFSLVKSYLQHAAILSQLTIHQEALTKAIKAKEMLKQTALILRGFADDKRFRRDCKNWTESLDIMLEKFVYEITNRDPTVSGSHSRLPMDENGGQSSMDLSGSTNSQSSQTSGIIFWKHNPKNNEKYLKKELAKRYGDSFKGKKMSTAWLEEFNIGNIMHLNPITFRELVNDDITPVEILCEEKLVELVLVYSCCLFSVATENRFICHKELETDKKATELSGPSPPIAKNYQLLQNHNFKQS